MRVNAKFDNRKSVRMDITKKFFIMMVIVFVGIIVINRYLQEMILTDNLERMLKDVDKIQLQNLITVSSNKVVIIDTILIVTAIIIGTYITWKDMGKMAGLLNGVRVHIEYLINGVYHYRIKDKYLVREDEIGAICKALDTMQKSTIEMVSDMKGAAEDVTGQSSNLNYISQELTQTAGEISMAINNIVQGISNESIDIEVIVDKINEFNGILGKALNDIKLLSQMAEEVNVNAKESNTEVMEITKSLQSFNSTFITYTDNLDEMNSNIKKVNDITHMINSIAEQTNLLAINAAIEAARAGEAGMGFSVVAEEIRKLSDQTKDSSVSINNIIANVLKSSEELANKTYEINSGLYDQRIGMNRTIKAFNTISTSITKMGEKISVLAERSNMINSSSVDIMGKVETLSSVNQEICVSTEEIAASSEKNIATSNNLLKSSLKLKENADISINYINKFILDGVEEED